MKDISHQYSIVRWVVYTFSGGVVNTLALQIFIDFYLIFNSNFLVTFGREMETHEVFYVFSIPIIILFFIPIILSLVLTKFHPEKRIVPPIFIQIITASLFYTLSYGRPNVLSQDTIFLSSYYLMIGSFIQDSVITTILGRTASKEDIIIQSFTVDTNISCLQTILSSDSFRTLLNLSKKYKTLDNRIIFRCPKKRQYQTIIELFSIEKIVVVTVGFFKKGRYALKRNNELDEYAKRQMLYLTDILKRPKYSLKIGTNNDSTHEERLLNYILDEMKGQSLQLEKMSPSSWVKAIIIIIVIVVSISLLIFECLTIAETLALIIPAMFYGIFEVAGNR